MPIADLDTLVDATAQNLSQLKGLAAAYEVLLGGVPTIDGLTFLINENNDTNFGSKTAGTDGPVFNDENIYINTINALYQGNPAAKTAFDAIVAAGASLSDKLTLVYNEIVPPAARTDAGLLSFKAQSQFYMDRAAELGVAGDNGAALVAFASLTKIAVDNDIGGLGDSINDLVAAINDGSAAIPQDGDVFTPIETADGTNYDGDDLDNSLTLTEGVDILSGEIFNAPRGFTPGGTDQVNTLNDDDVLTGTGDNDVLNFTFVNDSDTDDYDINPTLIGIETINVDVRTDEDAELDLQDSTGVHNLNVSGVDDSREFTFDNIQDAAGDGGGLNLSINDSNDDDSDIYFLFDEDAVSGMSDAVNLTLNDVDLDSVEIDDENYTSGLGVETVNLTSTGGRNSVNELYIEDAETLMIDGDTDLKLGSTEEAFRSGTNQVEAFRYDPGLGGVAGSLSVVDASAFTANLDLTIGAEISADQDGTSGTEVDLKVTGGAGDDMFRLTSIMDSADDVIDGGAGANTVQIFDSVIDGTVSNIQMLDIRGGHDVDNADDTIEVDTSLFPELETIWIRNEGMEGYWVSDNERLEVILDEVSEDLAQNIFLQHSSTESNGIEDNYLEVNLAADTADDTVAVTWVDQLDEEDRGINIDPRFNFELNADADGAPAGEGVENVTLNDTDSESNSVRLSNLEEHTGTLTLTGGQVGEFLNLDTIGGGIYGLDLSGQDDGDAADSWDDAVDGDIAFNGGGSWDRTVFETIAAADFVGDSIIRLGDVEVDAVLGSGDDTLIFDALNDNRAGLTISDSADGGDGNDVLVIDGGNVANISIGASEWTNVSNFETIRLVQNDGATGGNAGGFGTNDYNLRLTDDLIDNNGVVSGGGRVINIINDNGLTNETAATIGDTDGSTESGVTIDARTLSANRSFTYDGEEGGFETADRFIMADANINGMAIIDGGAADTIGTANSDVLEVRNAAVVTTGDLAGISNIGTLEFSNDTAAVQESVLQLSAETIDALVNDFHDAFDSQVDLIETLTIQVSGNSIGGAPTVLNIEDELSAADLLDVGYVVSVTGDAAVTINNNVGTTIIGDGDANNITSDDGDDTIDGGAGDDTINALGGDDTITGGAGNDNIATGTGDDTVVFNQTGDATDQISDFVLGAANDQFAFSTGGFTLDGTVSYAEGTGAAVADGDVLVLTDAFATVALAAAAIAGNAAVTTTEGFFAFFNSTDGEAQLVYSDDLAGDGTETVLADLTNVTLVGTMANFDATDFTFIA